MARKTGLTVDLTSRPRQTTVFPPSMLNRPRSYQRLQNHEPLKGEA